VFPIVGGRKVEHLQDIKLTDKQIEYLDSVKPLDVGFPNNFIGEDPHETGKSASIIAGSAPLAWVRNPRAIGHE
jgi:hypothetical protein